MKIKLGALRKIVKEQLDKTTSRFAPSDDDARTPGHLPEELPNSTGHVDEESWVPGRWMPGEGEPASPRDLDKLGDVSGMDEAEDELEMSSHLSHDSDGQLLGDDTE